MKIPIAEMHSNQAEDAELVAKAKKDMKYFEVLYRKYYSQIFKFVRKRVANADLVNDITSQVFLKAMLNLQKYKHQGFPFSSWLYRIALSELGDMFRAETAERALKVEWSNSTDLLNDIDNPGSETDVNQLAAGLNSLSEDSLSMIEMRYFEKRSFREIGEILGIAENNAKVKSFRIVNKLRKSFPQP